MFFYLDLHYKLTKLRRTALETPALGPKVLLIGEDKPERLDIGRLLVNYAAKLNMEPIFVDLDPENIAFIDGSISATHVRWRMPDNFMDYTKKLVYFYGSNRIHRKTYLQQVQVLIKATLEKLNRGTPSKELRTHDVQRKRSSRGIPTLLFGSRHQSAQPEERSTS